MKVLFVGVLGISWSTNCAMQHELLFGRIAIISVCLVGFAVSLACILAFLCMCEISKIKFALKN